MSELATNYSFDSIDAKIVAGLATFAAAVGPSDPAAANQYPDVPVFEPLSHEIVQDAPAKEIGNIIMAETLYSFTETAIMSRQAVAHQAQETPTPSATPEPTPSPYKPAPSPTPLPPPEGGWPTPAPTPIPEATSEPTPEPTPTPAPIFSEQQLAQMCESAAKKSFVKAAFTLVKKRQSNGAGKKQTIVTGGKFIAEVGALPEPCASVGKRQVRLAAFIARDELITDVARLDTTNEAQTLQTPKASPIKPGYPVTLAYATGNKTKVSGLYMCAPVPKDVSRSKRTQIKRRKTKLLNDNQLNVIMDWTPYNGTKEDPRIMRLKPAIKSCTSKATNFLTIANSK